MINLKGSSILHIDLETREYFTKSYPDLKEVLGGVGLASKSMLDYHATNPLIFAVGPLNGFFPYVSKTCAAFLDLEHDTFSDYYVGGRLSTRLKFTGYDAVIFENVSESPVFVSITDNEVLFAPHDVDPFTLGVPGRRSITINSPDGLQVDDYFNFGNDAVRKKMLSMNISGFSVSSTSDYKFEDLYKYEKKYFDILGQMNKMLVPKDANPSCSGCPMGCFKSKIGEIGGNLLVHSLVACIYSEPIFSDVSNVFACLTSLGYDYTHEDLERLPSIIYSNIERINEKANHS